MNYLLQDKQLLEILTLEEAQFKRISHLREIYHVYMPDNVKASEFSFMPKFVNIPDVVQGKLFKGPLAVAPVFKQGSTDQVLMFVQLEHAKGASKGFDRVKDKRAFEILGKIIGAIFSKILLNSQTSLTQERAYTILKTCK